LSSASVKDIKEFSVVIAAMVEVNEQEAWLDVIWFDFWIIYLFWMLPMILRYLRNSEGEICINSVGFSSSDPNFKNPKTYLTICSFVSNTSYLGFPNIELCASTKLLSHILSILLAVLD
jgi:hypothetical protein